MLVFFIYSSHTAVCIISVFCFVDHRKEVRGKGVLELGCGVGLPGVAAAVLGAAEVTLTDMVCRLVYPVVK